MARGCNKGNNFCSNKTTFNTQRLGEENVVGPNISLSKSTIDFDNVYQGLTANNSYSVSGSNLTDDITINSNDSTVEISIDGGSNWNTSYVLPQVGGVVVLTNVLVRYSPTTPGAASDTISHISTGATTKNVLWTSNVIQPSISVVPDNVDFGNVIVGNNAILNYTVNAIGLSGQLYINSTNPRVEVSIDAGANWATSYYVNPDGNGTISNLAVKARYTPTGSASDGACINHVALYATTQYYCWVGRGIVLGNIYSENFDAAPVSGSPGAPSYKYPSGWTDPVGTPSNPTTGQWIIYDDGGIAYPYSNDAVFGLPGASGLRNVAFSNGSPISESITSKPFSTVGKINITLDFKKYNQIGATNLIIEWSDNNSTWNSLSHSSTVNNTWEQVNTINLPAGAENKANIYLRFSSIGDGTGLFFAIDDLVVKGYS